jgi:hypothetical protein
VGGYEKMGRLLIFMHETRIKGDDRGCFVSIVIIIMIANVIVNNKSQESDCGV